MAAAVAIALAGIVLFVGADGLDSVVEDGEETGDDASCGFLESEIEAERIDPDDPQWEDQIDDCDIDT